jgi:hypothetical protein
MSRLPREYKRTLLIDITGCAKALDCAYQDNKDLEVVIKELGVTKFLEIVLHLIFYEEDLFLDFIGDDHCHDSSVVFELCEQLVGDGERCGWFELAYSNFSRELEAAIINNNQAEVIDILRRYRNEVRDIHLDTEVLTATAFNVINEYDY